MGGDELGIFSWEFDGVIWIANALSGRDGHGDYAHRALPMIMLAPFQGWMDMVIMSTGRCPVLMLKPLQGLYYLEEVRLNLEPLILFGNYHREIMVEFKEMLFSQNLFHEMNVCRRKLKLVDVIINIGQRFIANGTHIYR